MYGRTAFVSDTKTGRGFLERDFVSKNVGVLDMGSMHLRVKQEEWMLNGNINLIFQVIS